MKKLIPIIILLLLTSCYGGKKEEVKEINNTNNNNNKNYTINNQKNNLDTPIGKTKEERDNIIMLYLKEDDKKLLKEYKKAKELNENEKTQELLIKIKDLINKKEQEIIELEKQGGQNDKIKLIKKDLRVFYIISRGK